MAKRNLYRDWLKAEQTNVNNAPAIVRPTTTVWNNPSYADLMLRNEQIRNTSETARGGYSALAPAVETVSATVPKLASANPYDEDFNAGAAYGVYGVKKTENGATAPATTPATGTSFSFANLDDASKARMKQNNPALYNQLLVQGIITPLAEDQKPTATAPTTEKKTETVQKTDAGSPSTGETEQTFADYLALHPEYDEAKRQAEADYYRNRATYGANAETLAQMGVHGGYGDYVDAQAYAQKQQDKANIDQAARQGYAAYLAKGGETATDEAASNLYDILTGEDYNLLSYSDEAYATQKERIVADLAYRNVPSAVIDEAFRRVEGMRKKNTDVDVSAIGTATEAIKSGADVEKYLQTLGVPVSPQRAEYESDDAYNKAVEEYKENPSKFLTAKYYDTLDSLYENKKISQEVVSKAIINTLPIYGKDIETSGWKNTGVFIESSIEKVIDAKENDEITDEDYKAFVEKVKEVLKNSGVTSLKYKDTGVTANLFIRMNVNGDEEDINADQIGGKPDTATLKKLKQYDKLPLAYLKNEDGTFTLYYQNRSGWRQLSTKKGSTDGVPAYGNNWFTAIAFVMMNNGIDEEIKTKENNWFKSTNWTYNIK